VIIESGEIVAGSSLPSATHKEVRQWLDGNRDLALKLWQERNPNLRGTFMALITVADVEPRPKARLRVRLSNDRTVEVNVTELPHWRQTHPDIHRARMRGVGASAIESRLIELSELPALYGSDPF